MILLQCSAMCGPGTQSRNVECRNISGQPSPSSQSFIIMMMMMMMMIAMTMMMVEMMMNMMSGVVKMMKISNERWMRGSKTSGHKDLQWSMPPIEEPESREAQWLDQAGRRHPPRQRRRARRRWGGGVWRRELWRCARPHGSQTSWRRWRRRPQTCESEPKVSFTPPSYFFSSLCDGWAEKWKKIISCQIL